MPRSTDGTAADAAHRSDALERVRPSLSAADVALVGHAHLLRMLAARWLGQPPATGRLLRLDTAALSILGYEHGRKVVLRWNSPAG